jgi:hypothetical protein
MMPEGGMGLGLSGVRITTSPHLTVGPFEDWSQVRSPSRAERRRRQGHAQRIRYYYKPSPDLLRLPDGSYVGHPETVARLRQMIAEPVPA